ncbi:DUF3124 domain-containing protein [Roseibium sp. RKSG952]|uniref:DUF3124 domain-containing protein n=1 Tax=Roseibium sp. RKSG952 TaxID=2529384 RepID=UPI0018AD1B8A|nr:DUF3124 domain-containing protein [Roseibium sp. RKSG952]
MSTIFQPAPETGILSASDLTPRGTRDMTLQPKDCHKPANGGYWRAVCAGAFAVGLAAFAPTNAIACADEDQCLPRLLGASVYVPAYSQVSLYKGNRLLTAATLVVHNVDPDTPLTLSSVEYYNHSGERLKAFLDKPVTLAPLSSADYLVPVNDQAGGVGANFVLKWTSETPALPPISETVMVGGSGTQAFSFTSRGRMIAQSPASAPQ